MVDWLGNMRKVRPSDRFSPPTTTFGTMITKELTRKNVPALTQIETHTIWTPKSITTLKKMKDHMWQYLFTSAIAQMHFLTNNRGAGAEMSGAVLLSPKYRTLVQTVNIPDRACLLNLGLRRKPNQSRLGISKSQREIQVVERCGMKMKLSHMTMIWSLTWI